MNWAGYLSEKLNELITGIDAGDFNDALNIPQQYTFSHLWALWQYESQLEGGADLYRKLFEIVTRFQEHTIREKIRGGEKINVVFLIISASEWAYESLYRLLERDERFQSAVVVTRVMDHSDDIAEIYCRKAVTFFMESGHNVFSGYDFETGRALSFEEIGIVPDMVIHGNSWWQSLPFEQSIMKYPIKYINLYMPYGMNTTENEHGNFVQKFEHNKEFHNLMYRTYTDTLESLDGFRKYELLRGYNARYSGYAKMDEMYEPKEYSDEEIRSIWKIPRGKKISDYKKVIIAPHWTIRNKGIIHFSTFDKNLYFFLYLAEKYFDKITFIFKPHPNLRSAVVEKEVFTDDEAYQQYLRRWDALPNAKVVEEASYIDMFRTSDGIIMDSGSFIAEYVYADRPGLYLTRPEQAFSKLGMRMMKTYYKADGSDYQKIEDFLKDTILGENDPNKTLRLEELRGELDYPGKNGCLAGEYMYRDILALIDPESDR